MKKNVLLIYPIFLICTLVCSCKSESQKFSDLLKSKDLEKAYEFQTKYPKSPLAIDSLIAEIEYPKLMDSKNINDYKEFLKKHEYCRLVDSIKMKLAELVWIKIIDGKETLDKYNPYLVNQLEEYNNDFPKNPHQFEIDEWYLITQENGTFTDSRDGKKYKWKKIGNQTWMTERLEYLKYYRKPVMNAEDWWKYTYFELSNACPTGWHVPTHDDWIKAIETASRTTFDEQQYSRFNGFPIQGYNFFSEACSKEIIDDPIRNHERQFWSMSFNNSGGVGLLCIDDVVSLYSGSYSCRVFFTFGDPSYSHTVLCVKDSK